MNWAWIRDHPIGVVSAVGVACFGFGVLAKGALTAHFENDVHSKATELIRQCGAIAKSSDPLDRMYEALQVCGPKSSSSTDGEHPPTTTTNKDATLRIDWPSQVVTNVARVGGTIRGLSVRRYRLFLYMVANDSSDEDKVFWLNRPDREADILEGRWAIDARFGDEFPDVTHIRRNGLTYAVVAVALTLGISPPLDENKPDFVTAKSFDRLKEKIKERDPHAIFSNEFQVSRTIQDPGPKITELRDRKGSILPSAGSMLVAAVSPLSIGFNEPTVIVERYRPGYEDTAIKSPASLHTISFSPTDGPFELLFRTKEKGPITSLWVHPVATTP